MKIDVKHKYHIRSHLGILSAWVISALIVFFILMQSCIKFSNTYSAIPPGIWRATFELAIDSADVADEHSRGILPFNFEVVYATPDSFYIVIHNGEERIMCTDIAFARDKSIAKDTIRIVLPAFGTYLTGKCEEDVIEGSWWDPSRGSEYHIPFKAHHGRNYRFDVNAESSYKDFSGRWQAQFETETPTPYPAVLIVDQQYRHATATILTETGDYRYLEGDAENERLYLSTFDGSHAYLFEAKLLPDGTISGVYRSGNHYKTYWTAQRNENAKLADPDSIAELRDGVQGIQFSFPNTEGKIISLNDARYQGKPKIISIFGSWCPNCMDENRFLTDYVRSHPDLGVEIISIAFERNPDSEKAKQAVRRYKAYFDMPWEVLFGGSSKQDQVAQELPLFRNNVAFPTILFLDSQNHVVKIHSGFYGPATQEYSAFKTDFEETVRKLTSTDTEG